MTDSFTSNQNLIADLEAIAMQLEGTGGWPRAGLTARAAIREIERLTREHKNEVNHCNQLASENDRLRAALELFLKQWNACGPNSDFGRYFANVRVAAEEALRGADETTPDKAVQAGAKDRQVESQ